MLIGDCCLPAAQVGYRFPQIVPQLSGPVSPAYDQLHSGRGVWSGPPVGIPGSLLVATAFVANDALRRQWD